MDDYRLVLGLPHTNHRGLSEHHLMMQAGHFQWTSIARAIGRPLSRLRTLNGSEVYATFFFIEERFPAHTPITSFQLDDTMRFAVFLRAFKGIAVEGRVVFDHESQLREWLATGPTTPGNDRIAQHPSIRFGNIFITPAAGNSLLKVAAPHGVDFSSVPELLNDENPYHLTRAAERTGALGLIDPTWARVDAPDDFEVAYAIDIDRDTNGAGLVYFANYIAFMESAERLAVAANLLRFSEADMSSLVVEIRRVAYYGNVSTSDRVRTRVQVFAAPNDWSRVGFRYEIRRDSDNQLICLSEAVKVDPQTSRR